MMEERVERGGGGAAEAISPAPTTTPAPAPSATPAPRPSATVASTPPKVAKPSTAPETTQKKAPERTFASLTELLQNKLAIAIQHAEESKLDNDEMIAHIEKTIKEDIKIRRYDKTERSKHYIEPIIITSAMDSKQKKWEIQYSPYTDVLIIKESPQHYS